MTTQPTSRWAALAAFIITALSVACGDDSAVDTGDDGLPDGGTVPDVGVDADAGSMDADDHGRDSGPDRDTSGDGGLDAAVDTAGADAAEDAAADGDVGLGDSGFGLPDVGPGGGATCDDVTFAYDAGEEVVTSATVAGSFNEWAGDLESGGWGLEDSDSDNVWTTARALEPGTYEYKFVINGDWRQDPSNPDGVDDGFGGQNSVLSLECGARLTLLEHATDEGLGRISATVLLAPDELVLDATELEVTLNHAPVANERVVVSGDEITIEIDGLADGIHDLRVTARSTEGHRAGPVLLKFHLGISTDWADSVLYFAMTDRFRNGNAANDQPLETDWRVNWQGGDFAGLRQTIDGDYFTELGVNAIWISWPIDNFGGLEPGGRAAEHRCNLAGNDFATESVGYSAYHGYWPSDTRRVESRFGTLRELEALVDAAHARGIRIVLDFTANHVHTSSAFFERHRDDGFFNWPDNGHEHVCGDVGWDTEPETCWFTSYMADIDYRNPAAVNAVVDNAVEWIVASGADGFRVDAVKHVDRALLRSLRQRLRDEVELTGIDFYLVGETFTGDAALIASYLGDDQIHGQFDFPLNLQVLEAFARENMGLDALDANARGIKAVYGGALMSNFIGNHDIARFTSQAAGDIFCGSWDVLSNIAQGWLYPPAAPSGDEAYQRLRLAFTYIMTTPGIPLIYYGDEFGMPGGGDPDNRRMMRFDDELNGRESDTLDFMRRLGQVRAQHAALRTGEWGEQLWIEADVLAYSRTGGGETAVVILNRSGEARTLTLDLGSRGVSDGTGYIDALSETPAAVTVSGGTLTISVPPRTAAILVEE